MYICIHIHKVMDVDIGGYTGGSEDHLIGKTEVFITREVIVCLEYA